ncbi:MAG: SurA N-terminal domain-containing protein [Lachnospirales bacterium]
MIKFKSLFVLILALIVSGCSSIGGGDYVLSIDGEKISTTEYNIYLDEQIKSFEEQGGSDIWGIDFDGVPAKTVAKQNAVNTIVMVKAAVAHADQLGISLNDDEIKEAKNRAVELNPSGENLELVEKIMEESAIQSKVFDKITDSYKINEDEFENYLKDYYEQNKHRYSKYNAKEIFIQSSDTRYSYDDIKAKFDSIKSSEDFDSLADEISPDVEITAQILDTSLYSEEVSAKLAKSEEGDFILAEDTTGYHIFEIISVSFDSIDSIRETIKEQYITEKKQEIYNAQNDSWTSAMKVEKNSAVYDDIDIEFEVTTE